MRVWFAVVLVACGSHQSGVHRQLVVSTNYPGVEPAVIESSVTTPLERQFGQIPHLAEMRSRSRVGHSEIELAFEPGTELDAAMQEVQAAINHASNLLPRSLPAPPTYNRVGELVARYAVTTTSLAQHVLRDKLEPIEQRIAQVAGVGLVDECGARPREIDVEVDPITLAGTGMTITEVVAALKAAPAADDLGPTPIGARNGVPIRLSDVARIEHDRRAADCVATTDKGPAIELIVWAQPDTTHREVRERVDRLMADMRTQLPAGVDVRTIGPTHVWEVEAETPAERSSVLEAMEMSPQWLVEERDPIVRVAVPATEDTVALVTGTLPQLPGILAIEPDATLELSGPDRDALNELASTVRANIGPSLALGLDRTPVKQIELDRDAMSRLGVTPSEADDTLLATVGIRATTIFSQTTQTPVVVHLSGELDTLDRVYVRGGSGSSVPLSAFARVVTTKDGERWHSGQFPMVGFRVRAETVPDLAKLHVPPSIHVRLVRD